MRWTGELETELKTRWKSGERIASIARSMGVTRNTIIGKSNRLGLQFLHGTPNVLRKGSDADTYGATAFSKQVKPPVANVLKPGSYQRKLGPTVTKGVWKNFPIYSLTLEERATCPRTCKQWLSCYGNNMGRSIRYAHGDALEAQLWKELFALQMSYPKGFVVRLHILGDFYSVEYVRFWERALHKFRALHVFGYTARKACDPIGMAVEDLRDRMWDRFAVRSSGARVGPRARVIQREIDARDAIICPAQTSDRTCATCALCWTTKKPIAFLQH